MKKSKKIKSVKHKIIPNVDLPLTSLGIIKKIKEEQTKVSNLKTALKDFFSRVD
jgi:hypothetical protein